MTQPVDRPARRKAILQAHKEGVSFRTQARLMGVNVRYVADFALRGIVPHNWSVRARMGIPPRYPRDLWAWPREWLRWAMEKRETF